MLRSYRTMVTHVKGLISLLNEYKENPEASDPNGNLISSDIFISTYGSGVSCFNII